MSYFSKMFSRECLGDKSVDKQLNSFLSEHPNLKIDNISFSKDPGKVTTHLFVIFKEEEKFFSKMEKEKENKSINSSTHKNNYQKILSYSKERIADLLLDLYSAGVENRKLNVDYSITYNKILQWLDTEID